LLILSFYSNELAVLINWLTYSGFPEEIFQLFFPRRTGPGPTGSQMKNNRQTNTAIKRDKVLKK